MSTLSKAIQLVMIILLILIIVVYNKDILNIDSILSYIGLGKNKKKSKKKSKREPVKIPDPIKEDSDDLFNTEYAATEELDEAMSEALKSVV